MNYKELINNWYIKSLVTDILYADMEAGNVDFLKKAYDKLGINKTRIMEMRKKYPKIGSKAINMVYEDIISIITEELYQKGNVELYMDLMDFYLQRFPCMKEQFDACGHDIVKWLHNVRNIQESVFNSFVRQTFILLYCYTYGDSDVHIDLIVDFFLEMDNYYTKARYGFYEYKENTEDSSEWVERAFGISDFKNSEMFKESVEKQKEVLADFCGIAESDYFEEIFVRDLMRLNSIEPSDGNVQSFLLYSIINAICRKHHMNQLKVFNAGKQVYLNIFKEVFEQMCMKEIVLKCYLGDDYYYNDYYDDYYDDGYYDDGYYDEDDYYNDCIYDDNNVVEEDDAEDEDEDDEDEDEDDEDEDEDDDTEDEDDDTEDEDDDTDEEDETDDEDEEDDVLDFNLLVMACLSEINNPEAFLTELILTFWFECYLMSQKELYDDYYKNFSLSSSETNVEELRKENSRLKDELNQCKLKLQQYSEILE